MEWKVLQAMAQCRYKSWLLAKEKNQDLLEIKENEINFPFDSITQDKISITAWYHDHMNDNELGSFFQVRLKNGESIKIRIKTSAAKV